MMKQPRHGFDRFLRPVVRRQIKAHALLFLIAFLSVHVPDAYGQSVPTPRAFRPARCEIIPLPEHRVSFRIDGVEKLQWHTGSSYPRPFLYPFAGPSGESLTRMGHPGAQNHDHHRSIWFAHHSVNGVDFWSDSSKAIIRQKFWYRYRDGDQEAVMASCLGWFDPQGVERMEQDLVVALIPLADNEHAVEIQLTLRPGKGLSSVKLDKTNFGLLAVRVAASLSTYFGGGQLSDSEDRIGEPQIFGKQARWMDYSGPITVGTGSERIVVTEGITYHDHPSNPRYPTPWHVREDGWMGASYGMESEQQITSNEPLTLRYLLHAHSGEYDSAKAEQIHSAFGSRPPFRIRKPNADETHRQFEVERQP